MLKHYSIFLNFHHEVDETNMKNVLICNYKLSYNILHDTRCKFEVERVYGIERNDTTIKMYINMSHIYCDLLLLIYWFHWKKEGMVTDIVYNIHNFLKGHHDCNYNLIWDNKTHYKYLFN